jgi:hypothetical protein
MNDMMPPPSFVYLVMALGLAFAAGIALVAEPRVTIAAGVLASGLAIWMWFRGPPAEDDMFVDDWVELSWFVGIFVLGVSGPGLLLAGLLL